jgi:Flp pilus assembly protein TadD
LPNGASDLILEAQKLFAAHNFEQARAKYLEVLELDNRNVYTLGNLATIELEMNQTAAAEEHLQSALALNPKDAFSLGVLGNLRFRQGKYDQALDALSHAAELNPKDAEVQNFLGVTLSQKGQRAAAETALRKAIQLDPEYGSAHNNLAVIYLTQTPPQIELARWHYQKALAAGQGHNPELESLLDQSARSPAAQP